MSEKLPPQQKGAFFAFLKSLASFQGDLASLTAPAFLLAPQSIVEFAAYWAAHPALFVAPASEPDPARRALLVLRWFLSTLREQHSSRDAAGRRKPLKPLNPFLGELFRGRWVDGAGTTRLVAEQVSHHPPVTACAVWNDEHGVRLRGHVAPQASFTTTVQIERRGYSLLHLDRLGEDYLITMPKMHLDGIVTGSLAPELSGTSYIHGSSGYTARIQYSCRGWLGGKRNSFVASVFRAGREHEPRYSAAGQWSGEFTMTDLATGEVVERFDARALPATPLTVAPVAEQDPLESRRAWQAVVRGIEQGDLCTVSREKSKLENEQRALRKREKAAGLEWPRRYFSKLEVDERAEALRDASRAGTDLTRAMDGTRGVWVWDEEKYRKVTAAQSRSAPVVRERVTSPTRTRYDSGVGGIVMNEGEERGK